MNKNKSCHGQFNDLSSSSESIPLYKLAKGYWIAKNKGFSEFMSRALSKIKSKLGMKKVTHKDSALNKGEKPADEVLNLKAGELVEVKSKEEVLATLDHKGQYKGLSWMLGMDKFCGRRYRVYKRLDRILLESTGELRKIKNTVLLESVECDGKEFFDCNRSCYHYWREIWLKRVDENEK